MLLDSFMMADWGSWKNSSGGSDLMSYYNNCSQLSPSLMNSSPYRLSPAKVNSEFCTQDTLDQCTSILNQELMMLGLSTIYGEDSDTVDLCCLINSCHDLIVLHQRSTREREELETRYHRSLSDLDQSQTVQSRLKADLDYTKRQLAQCQEKERQLTSKHRATNGKLKAEKEEVRRLQGILNSRDLQYKHDVKKRERETNKLKERLHQVLMDKKHERQIGMDIVNAVSRSDGRRSTWKTGSNKQEEEMYRAVISNYEHKQQTLMVENSKLRDTLQGMQSEIISLLNQQDSPIKTSLHSDSPEASLSCSDDDISVVASECSVISTDKISEGVYQMPYDMVRKDIEKNFHETCQMLKEVVKQSKKQRDTGCVKKDVKESKDEYNLASTPLSVKQNNVEDLVDKLNKFKWIVKEQEELIQQSLQSQSKSVENSFRHDSQLLHDKESLAEERKRLQEEKVRFEEERKHLTEAAIRLGRERRELEDEKTRVFQQQFLQLSPFGSNPESTLVKSTKSEGTSRMLPSTPNYAKNPSIVVTQSPSPDIYRVMGLGSMSPSKKSGVKTKPPISPQITKAPRSDPGTGDGPGKGSLNHSTPASSVDTLSHSLDSLKKALFNGKINSSHNRQTSK